MKLFKSAFVVIVLFLFAVVLFNQTSEAVVETTDTFNLKTQTSEYTLSEEYDNIVHVRILNGTELTLEGGIDYTIQDNAIVLDTNVTYNNNDTLIVDYTYPPMDTSVYSVLPYIFLIGFTGLGIYIMMKSR